MPLNYSKKIDWDIRIFSFPILGSLQFSSVKIYVALGVGRRSSTYGFEAVSQEMRPNSVFELLARPCLSSSRQISTCLASLL